MFKELMNECLRLKELRLEVRGTGVRCNAAISRLSPHRLHHSLHELLVLLSDYVALE